jgi:GAF domain-containing protein
VRPIPETSKAMLERSATSGMDISGSLIDMGRKVQAIVPQCIGLSLGVIRDGLTFTLVATDEELATLDAVQYVAGGPCVDATGKGEGIIETQSVDLLDEGRWQLFASASAASNVQSTLSLPIGDEGHVVAGVNLYATTRDAFQGHHEELAEALGAWAPGIVSNADLSFSTRLAAAAAPGQIREQSRVDITAGMLAQTLHIPTDEARERLHQAATRAGVPLQQLTLAIQAVLQDG